MLSTKRHSLKSDKWWNLDRCYCLNINISEYCLGPSWWHSSEGLWKLWLYGPAKRNTSLRGFEGYTWLFLSFPLSLLTICWMVSFSYISCNHDVVPHRRPRINVSKEQELKSLKQAPQIFTEFFLQIFTLSSAKVTNTELVYYAIIMGITRGKLEMLY